MPQRWIAHREPVRSFDPLNWTGFGTLRAWQEGRVAMRTRRIAPLVTLICISAGSALAQPVTGPEQFNVNTTCPNPTGCTNFEVVLSGMPRINIMQTLSNPGLDPFTFINPATSALTSFVSPQFNFNTVVMFSGSPIPPGNINQFGPAGNPPHFGLFTVGNVPLNPLEDFWTWPGGGFKTLPLVNFGPGLSCTVPVGDCAYANVYLEFVGGDPQTDGMWVTFLVNPDVILPNDLPTLQNFTGLPMTVTNAGFFLSPTQIPLDEMNQIGEPPPGQPGSPFTPAPSLLGPVPLPEPASLILFAAGVLLLAVKNSLRSSSGGRLT
jgi:hypothetical protein